MTTEKLNRLKKQIEKLRRKGGITSSEVERLAAALGRAQHKRGKEPTWINEDIPNLPPLSIPHHSKDLNRFTAQSILDQLEMDIEAIESSIAESSDGEVTPNG